MDSLHYDLDKIHLDSVPLDTDTVSEASSQDTGRDSALGSVR